MKNIFKADYFEFSPIQSSKYNNKDLYAKKNYTYKLKTEFSLTNKIHTERKQTLSLYKYLNLKSLKIHSADNNALVYCENEFGCVDGKVANGLIRHSESYTIVGVIDSTNSGKDSGEYLDGIKNGIPIFKSIEDAIQTLKKIPNYFIYGIAPLNSALSIAEREIVISAIKCGMHIVNGLPDFFTDDLILTKMAKNYGVTIKDVRKPPLRKDLHIFTGLIRNVKTPIITVLGTDCAVGKRTTSLLLVKALKQYGVNAVFITTGQTGLLQGSKYGIAIDVLTSGFATGEVEHAILKACEVEKPDIIIVEGQGALSHPAFNSSSAILRGAMPSAVILQHPPKRNYYCDYPNIPLLGLEGEIEMIESFSNSDVIAITINHEDMNMTELEDTINTYQSEYNLPTSDVLTFGCDKITEAIFEAFPTLKKEPKLS